MCFYGGDILTLYRASKKDFLEMIRGGANEKGFAKFIADLFTEEHGVEPKRKEIIAWQTSLPAMAKVLKLSQLPDSTQIFIEYTIPKAISRKSIDFMIVGKSSDYDNVVVIVELKAWDAIFSQTAKLDNGEPLHLAQDLQSQILTYKSKMEKRLEKFCESNGCCYRLVPCVYLYNYAVWTTDDEMVNLKNSDMMQDVHFFFRDERKDFIQMLNELIDEDTDDCSIIDDL